MRDPSLHIRRSKLIEVLSKSDVLGRNVDVEQVVDSIIFQCRAYSTSTRSVSPRDTKTEERLRKIQSSSRLDSDAFEKLIYAIRVLKRHRGISRIRPSSQNWSVLKEITSNALNFCEEFELPQIEGSKIYITIGMELMKKYQLNLFLVLNERISETYQAKVEIEDDDDKESTEDLYRAYTSIIHDEVGILENYKDTPTKYVWFVRAKDQARRLNVAVDLYVEAQFDGLGFSKGIPSPTQLVGDNATSRLSKFLYKNNYKIG